MATPARLDEPPASTTPPTSRLRVFAREFTPHRLRFAEPPGSPIAPDLPFAKLRDLRVLRV